MKRALLLVCAAALLVGCRGDDESSTGNDADTPTAISVYFLLDGKVWPVRRDVTRQNSETATALSALAAGPTEDEIEALGLSSEVPEELEEATILLRSDAPRRLVTDVVDLSDEALAQIVYTLTQIPPFSDEIAIPVDGEDRVFGRADFEEQTPSVLVESPLAFEEVSSPVQASGTANTFEANFHYTLTDTDGLIVDENFVTATSGTGTRGTFEFTTDEYTVPFDGIGALIVFERSAEDGSKVNIVEIPLRMSR